MAYYAWSPILYGAETDDSGNIVGQKMLQINDTVDAGTLGVDDDVFQEELVASGAVRDKQLPDDLISDLRSPRQLAADKMAARQEVFNTGDIPEELLLPQGVLFPTDPDTVEVQRAGAAGEPGPAAEGIEELPKDQQATTPSATTEPQ